MIEKGDLALPRYPLITHQRGTGLNLIRMIRALQRTPAETHTGQNRTRSLIPEEAQGPGLYQSPHHILEVDQSPDLVPSQGTNGQHQNHQEEQPLSSVKNQLKQNL